MTSLVWLRADLRLDDQPAIAAAAAGPALYVYLHDETASRQRGGAGRWWLDKSLAALAASLEAIGGRLDIVAGAAAEVIPQLARHVDAVYWTRRYGAAGHRDRLAHQGRAAAPQHRVESFNGQLLREPWEVKTDAGAPFKVFTPFWRRSRELGPFPPPQAAPKRLIAAPWPADAPRRVALADLKLHPTKPDWSAGIAEAWTPGEAGAHSPPEAFRRHRSGRLRRRARPAGSGGHFAPVAASQLRRDFAAPHRRRRRARRAEGRNASRRREIYVRDRLARVRLFAALPIAGTRDKELVAEIRRVPLARPTMRRWRPGGAAAPAIPWSTPPSASCGTPATCTTAPG